MSALIGIGGHLAAGKDAVADRLVEEHGFVKLNMSEPLHEAMLAIDPIISFETTGDFFDAQPISYSTAISRFGYTNTKARYPEARRLLQNLGTEVGRNMIGENVWVDIATRKIWALRAAGKSVVITGVRFPNELRMIAEDDGTLVWVTRPGHEPEAAAGQHASEGSVGRADFHVMIDNDSTLEALYAKADRLALLERVTA